ncbi:DUF6710 family protein [Treponema pectinovorum]|uniref:DUF6710 family protein n=1 Tax=Treponema pectinovorum TaxID=164 RepID=UPI0011C9B018|nr:DUF6710 family protein [Treponema pectinovorum]
MIIKKKAFYSSLRLYNEIKNYNVTELQNITSHLCDLVIYKYISSVLLNKEHCSMANLRMNQLFIDFCQFEKDYPFCKSVKTEIVEHEMNLNDSAVLSFPWKKGSVLWMLQEIPNSDFVWKEEVYHSITLVKPFNFYFVNSGNHSIAGGRIARKGTITCNDAIDYTNIIRTYDYDGKYFYNEINKRLNKPFLNEFGELFIIGKVLLEKTT